MQISPGIRRKHFSEDPKDVKERSHADKREWYLTEGTSKCKGPEVPDMCSWHVQGAVRKSICQSRISNSRKWCKRGARWHRTRRTLWRLQVFFWVRWGATEKWHALTSALKQPLWLLCWEWIAGRHSMPNKHSYWRMNKRRKKSSHSHPGFPYDT